MLIQISGTAVFCLFYGSYLLKMLVQRRSGVRTDQMGRGKAGGAQRLEIILKITTYLTAAAEVVSIINGSGKLPFGARLTGIVTAAVGTLVFIIAVADMKDSWRAGVTHDETALVTSGLFRISRNPAFLGFDLLYIGLAAAFFNLPLAALSALSCVMLHLQIVKNEEPSLVNTFGQEYIDYKSRVNRYFGVKRR